MGDLAMSGFVFRERGFRLLAIEFGMVSALFFSVIGGNFMPRPQQQQQNNPYSIHATFVEGCACPAPCPCDLFGVVNGCKGLGGLLIQSGMYQNTDLAGARIAFASLRGQWIKIYVDGRDKDQKVAAGAFAREALKDYGAVRWVRESKVDIIGKDGDYLVTVDDGRLLSLETEPVAGGDGRTALAYGNTRNALSPALFQGKTNKGRYDDGEESFALAGSNAYFNENVLGTGRF